MANKKVVVLPGDDAAPEAMSATMDVLSALKLPIDYVEFPPGEKWTRGETDMAARKAIDASDSTLFGSTSGKTTAITYLRWGKQTFANVLGPTVATSVASWYTDTSTYFRLTTRVTLGTTEFTLYSLLYRTAGGKVTPLLRTFRTL